MGTQASDFCSIEVVWQNFKLINFTNAIGKIMVYSCAPSFELLMLFWSPHMVQRSLSPKSPRLDLSLSQRPSLRPSPRRKESLFMPWTGLGQPHIRRVSFRKLIRKWGTPTKPLWTAPYTRKKVMSGSTSLIFGSVEWPRLALQFQGF